MSLDRSLKSHGALVRHRNVLTRAERLQKLVDEGRWKEEAGVFGLPKVAHRKVATKKIKAAVAAAPGAEGAAPADGAAEPKPATAAAALKAPAAKAPATKAPAAKGK